MHRQLLVLCLAAAVAGCNTVSNTLPPEQVAGFRLTTVNVGFAPDAKIGWGDGELAFAASKGVPSHEVATVADTPEAQAYLRNALAAKVKDALQRRLAPGLKGSRPVRVDVMVKEVSVSPVFQRVVVGGGHVMLGDVNLIDAKTGATLVVAPSVLAAVGGGSGVVGVLIEEAVHDPPIDRVVNGFATVYSAWLLPK
jgi:hypothetical protein